MTCMQVGDGPWQLCGIIPMRDPPRHDTAETIANVRAAGVGVKMITGDHLNIAIKTAEQIHLGTQVPSTPRLLNAYTEQNGQNRVSYHIARHIIEQLRDRL